LWADVFQISQQRQALFDKRSTGVPFLFRSTSKGKYLGTKSWSSNNSLTNCSSLKFDKDQLPNFSDPIVLEFALLKAFPHKEPAPSLITSFSGG
jgi:hypothetical protein